MYIDGATANVGLQYDGVSLTPVQFHFNITDFLDDTAGANSGKFLRIYVNNTEYKIALLAASAP
jgi:hypothetical protein